MYAIRSYYGRRYTAQCDPGYTHTDIAGEKPMARFHVQTTHTPEKCLSALDELVAMGPHEIDNSYNFV